MLTSTLKLSYRPRLSLPPLGTKVARRWGARCDTKRGSCTGGAKIAMRLELSYCQDLRRLYTQPSAWPGGSSVQRHPSSGVRAPQLQGLAMSSMKPNILATKPPPHAPSRLKQLNHEANKAMEAMQQEERGL
ncbi:hypothetical protein VNO77_02212 [Canavalia gladiata]|uniref:Uncharacterized protein n=1 Tax=Canavalia gladiata TaxID=3824 RepID=A0AAN9R2U6_CANGL